MFYKSQTWNHVVIEKMYVMYFVYNDFIQSISSNYWIKIDLDSKWTIKIQNVLSIF